MRIEGGTKALSVGGLGVAAKWSGRTAYQHPQSRAHGGKREDLGGQYFRSSAEANLARLFNRLRDHWEYEPKEFFFPLPRGTTSFLPDFSITICRRGLHLRLNTWPSGLAALDEGDYWVEAKGWMTPQSLTRLLRFAKYHPLEARRLLVLVHNPEKAFRDCIKKREKLQAAGVRIFDLRVFLELGKMLKLPGWEEGGGGSKT